MLILETSVLPIKLCPQEKLCRWKELNLRQWIFSPLLYRLSYICRALGERWDLNPYFYGHNIRFFLLNYFRLQALPDWNRTNNLLLIRQALYQLSYRQRQALPVGFEPTSSQPQCEILTQLNYGRDYYWSRWDSNPHIPRAKRAFYQLSLRPQGASPKAFQPYFSPRT